MPTVPPPSRDATADPVLFWFVYKTELLVALLVLLLGAVGFLGYRIYNDHRATAAADLLAASKDVPDYQRVIEQYPGTPASASAYLFLAERQGAKKNFKEANETLQTFLDKFPQHEMAASAHLAMASNLESIGKIDDALSMLQRLVSNNPKSFIAPLALLSQVHLLKAKGKIEDARHICENLLTQYRESAFSGEASQQLRLLKPPEAPSPAASAAPQTSAAPTVALPPNPAPKKP